MCLTHGAGSDDLPGIIQNNVFQATRDVAPAFLLCISRCSTCSVSNSNMFLHSDGTEKVMQD